ncbi:MAG: ABC transporter permease [bacterium]|nr:ABC transporter permease [bacterium]
MIENIIKIFKTEIKRTLTDPGCTLIMIGGVLLYSLFYSLPFSTHILHDVPIAVVDQDNSSFSRKLTRDFNSNDLLEVVAKVPDIETAKKMYYNNEIKAYVLIPKDFKKNITRGGFSYISAYEDSSYLIIYKQVATGIQTVSLTTGATFEIGKMMKKGIKKDMAYAIKMPFEFVQIPLFNPIGSYQNYIYPMVIILILQQTLLIGAGLLGGTVREEMLGIYRRTKECFVYKKRSSFNKFSKNPIEIVLGKSLGYVLIYLFYSIIFFLIFPALFCYKMNYYNFGLTLILVIPFLFAVSFLAQALVFFYLNRENSLLMLVVTSLPMIFFPGFIWPKEAMSPLLIAFSSLIPSTNAIEGLIRVNIFGANLYQVKGNLLNILFLCVLYFVLGCIVINKLNENATNEECE